MGGHVVSGRAGGGGRRPLSAPAVRVVPDIPSFAVADGFWYAVPDRLAGRVAVGSLVRVPLGGRRVGGFVVEVGEREASGLRPLAALSGEATVFDERLLAALFAVATHYVTPLPVLLRRAAPPNVPPGRTVDVPAADAPPGPVPPGLDDVVAEALAGRGRRVVAYVTRHPGGAFLAALSAPLVASGRGVLAVYPTAAEAAAAAAEVRAGGGRAHLAGEDARALTAAWAAARHGGGLVIGTPRVAAWPVADLGLLVGVEEGRRAMKDRQSPTVAVRDVLIARAEAEEVAAVFAGPTPSLELLAARPDVRRAPGRPWGAVEVVDRGEDPDGGRLLTERARRALAAVTARGGSSFLFAHRRGYSAAARCVRCGTVRTCPSCGSRPDPGETCRRCGAALGPCPCGGERFAPLGAGVGRIVEEAARIVGGGAVGAAPSGTLVTVGSEADLAGLEARDLVVLVDLDGLVLGTSFRAGEEALRVGARLAARARGRLLIQTADPTHPVVTALRRGDPSLFSEPELAVRAKYGYPPSGEIIIVELRSRDRGAEPPDSELRAAVRGAVVLGPAAVAGGWRWLVHGRDLAAARPGLRELAARWRDSGHRVRIDVDPLDV